MSRISAGGEEARRGRALRRRTGRRTFQARNWEVLNVWVQSNPGGMPWPKRQGWGRSWGFSQPGGGAAFYSVHREEPWNVLEMGMTDLELVLVAVWKMYWRGWKEKKGGNNILTRYEKLIVMVIDDYIMYHHSNSTYKITIMLAEGIWNSFLDSWYTTPVKRWDRQIERFVLSIEVWFTFVSVLDFSLLYSELL